MLVVLLILSFAGRLSANLPCYFGHLDPDINHVFHAIGKSICIVVLFFLYSIDLLSWVGLGTVGFLFLFGCLSRDWVFSADVVPGGLLLVFSSCLN